MEVHWGSPRKERLVLRTLDTNPFFLYNLKTLSLRPFSESASVQRRKHWHCHEPYHSLSLSLAQFPSLPPPPLVDSILLVPPLAESRAHEAGSIRSLKCIPTRTTYYAHHKGVFALSMTELIETARYDPFRVYIPLLAADGMFARCRRVGWILPASWIHRVSGVSRGSLENSQYFWWSSMERGNSILRLIFISRIYFVE